MTVCRRTRSLLAEALRLNAKEWPFDVAGQNYLLDLADRMERGELDVGDLIEVRRDLARQQEEALGKPAMARVCWCARPTPKEGGSLCEGCGCFVFKRRSARG